MYIKALLICFVILLLKTTPIGGHCPPYDLLKPCYCHSKTQSLQNCNNSTESSYLCQVPVITCAGDQEFNLSEVLFKVNKSISNENQRYFEWFYLSNTAITQLNANTFSGLHFKNIYLRQCLNLTTINSNAFNNSSQFVKRIWINSTQLSDRTTDKRNAFKAFNSLTNLKTLEIIGSQFTSIPSKAFNEYSSLKSISFYNYKEKQFLEKINSKAFYSLSDLRRIDLRNNRISKLNSFAFAFESQSNHTLRIHLENNYLNSNSFNPNALNGAKGRRVIVYLGGYNECNPDLKYLDKSVFESFLLENRRNIIELYGCPLQCDYNSIWMNTHKNFLNKRIRHLKCIPYLVLTKVRFNNNKNITKNSLIKREKYKTKKKINKKRTKKKATEEKPKPVKKQRMTLKLRLGLK